MPARCERVGSTAIKTHWRGVRFDYELSRDIRLDGNRLIVDYAIHHRDADSFRCAWSQHALLSRETAIELSLNSGSPWRRSHDHLGNDLPRDFAWPLVASGEDLSKPERLPAGRGWKVFSQGPIDAPAMIHYPVRKRILKMEYVSDDALPAYWGLWINSGGYKGIRQIALEPTHARSDYIAASIADNSAAIIARGSPRHWRVIWTIEPA
jgi:hypothetical protein